ncbi:hypothetical protein WISP_05376 [Willisornis vidua]|uniref:Uncharacterized protein n=1 Tax=Willisornis vidua TaxID=1566151 RepID=A0ABQ9DT07_9PASS|nr:hypothetical protein WISP_05376 [Willisornis vidua]
MHSQGWHRWYRSTMAKSCNWSPKMHNESRWFLESTDNNFLTQFVIFNPDLNEENGIYIRYRTDGSLFNLRRLKAHTKTLNHLVHTKLQKTAATFCLFYSPGQGEKSTYNLGLEHESQATQGQLFKGNSGKVLTEIYTSFTGLQIKSQITAFCIRDSWLHLIQVMTFVEYVSEP